MSLSRSQQVAYAVVPKFSGAISVTFSTLILFSVLRSQGKRRGCYHRLLAAASMVDILHSSSLSLSTWPVPRDSGVLWAVGTTHTCTAQGMFLQFGLTSVLYHAALSLYYVCIIRFNWKDAQIKRIEPFLSGVPFTIGAGTALAGLPLKLYNNSNLWCWIAPLPSTCRRADCVRGANADFYRYAFFYGPLWLMMILVMTNLVVIFTHVRKIEQAANSHRFSSHAIKSSLAGIQEESREEEKEETNNIQDTFQSPQDGTAGKTPPKIRCQGRTSRSIRAPSSARSRKVANQCLFYAAAFIVNWLPVSILRSFQAAGRPVPYWLVILTAIFSPLQGCSNALVYLYPNYVSERQKGARGALWRTVRRCFFESEEYTSKTRSNSRGGV